MSVPELERGPEQLWRYEDLYKRFSTSFASYTGALEVLDARQQQTLLWVIC